jgi:hypothetical protein
MNKYDMRLHDLLHEARLRFTAADVAAATARSEFGVIGLTMTGDGDLHLGDLWHARGDTTDPLYHNDVGWRRSLKITLQPHQKRLEIRLGSIGDRLKPKVQQALRSLRDGGIIDASWTIKTAHEAAGYQNGVFVTTPNPVDQQSLDRLVDKAVRLSPVTAQMVLYHGTSSRDWQRIQAVGLLARGTGSNQQHGVASRAKHSGNDNVLYLAGTLAQAQDYAKQRVEDWNRQHHGSPYVYGLDNEPVILAVQIPDVARLVADDDLINRLARGISGKLWRAKPEAERQQIMAGLSRQRGFPVSDQTVGEMLWRETDGGFAAIMAKLPARVFSAWKASLIRNNQVGYRGLIPPKFIRRVA